MTVDLQKLQKERNSEKARATLTPEKVTMGNLIEEREEVGGPRGFVCWARFSEELKEMKRN